MSNEPLIAVNGQIFDAESAFVPATDRGFLYGERVVEVMVCFYGKILNIESHLNRLEFSAKTCNFGMPWSRESIRGELIELAEKINIPKALLRIVITRGVSEELMFLQKSQPNRYIYAFPAPVINANLWENGVKLYPQDIPSLERGSAPKTGNYMRSIQNVEEAKKSGFDDILQINSEGEITEASTANIFLIGRHGDNVEIATPSEDSGLLLGITRETIISLLERSQIKVTQRVILKEEIPAFDEGFICSTVRGLVPIAAIGNHKMHSSRAKSIFQHIRRLHHTWAESQIGFRVDWNSAKRTEEEISLN